jgi:hypothetical protein
MSLRAEAPVADTIAEPVVAEKSQRAEAPATDTIAEPVVASPLRGAASAEVAAAVSTAAAATTTAAAGTLNRVADIDQKQQALSPILGIADTPLTTLAEALSKIPAAEANEPEMKAAGGSLDAYIMAADMAAATVASKPDDPLRDDPEAVKAIHIYTQEGPVYRLLNRRCRDANRSNLKVWFPYLRLLLHALFKLPPVKGTVYRGVTFLVTIKRACYAHGRARLPAQPA